MPEPTPTKFTNLDATTTWCRTCDLAVSMPHEHPITVPFAAATPTKPTPTVIDSDLTVEGAFVFQKDLPLCDQFVKVEGVVGLRYLLEVIFNTWRQGGDFSIIFTDNGKPGPTVTFEKPKGHTDYAAEILEVHR